MDCGAFAMDDGCLGAMETLPKVAVRSSMLTSFSFLVVVDSIFSSPSDWAAVCEEPLGMLTLLSLSLAACGVDFDPIASSNYLARALKSIVDRRTYNTGELGILSCFCDLGLWL